MIYLFPFESTFVIYENKSYIPPEQLPFIVEFESLPDGFGQLRMNEKGELYYYTPEPEPPEPTPEPEPEPIDSREVQLQVLINTELLLLYKEMGI